VVAAEGACGAYRCVSAGGSGGGCCDPLVGGDPECYAGDDPCAGVDSEWGAVSG
jgi:hypothetical protein